MIPIENSDHCRVPCARNHDKSSDWSHRCGQISMNRGASKWEGKEVSRSYLAKVLRGWGQKRYAPFFNLLTMPGFAHEERMAEGVDLMSSKDMIPASDSCWTSARVITDSISGKVFFISCRNLSGSLSCILCIVNFASAVFLYTAKCICLLKTPPSPDKTRHFIPYIYAYMYAYIRCVALGGPLSEMHSWRTIVVILLCETFLWKNFAWNYMTLQVASHDTHISCTLRLSFGGPSTAGIFWHSFDPCAACKGNLEI